MSSLRLVLMSALLLSTTACGGGYSSPSTAPSPTPSPARAPGALSASVAIPAGASSLRNLAYAPDELNVAVGTTVT